MQTSDDTPTTQPASPATETQEALSLFDLMMVLGRHKRLVFGLPVLGAIVGLVASLLLPVSYRSESIVASSKETPAAVLLGIAESDAVHDRIISKFDLAKRYGVATGALAQLAFESRVSARATRDGLLIITVTDAEAPFAANLADAMAAETIFAAHEGRLSATSQHLNRFRQRLARLEQESKANSLRLEAAGIKDWRTALPEGDRTVLATLADLQAELNSQQDKKETTRDNAQNALLLMQDRLMSIQRQLADRRSPPGGVTLTQDAFEAIKDEYYFAALKKRLDRHVENVKVEMADEIKPIAAAPVPLRKDKPKRSLIVAGATLAGLALGILLAFLLESTRSGSGNAARDARLLALRQAWGWPFAPRK